MGYDWNSHIVESLLLRIRLQNKFVQLFQGFALLSI